MIKSALLRSCSSPLFLEAKDLHRNRSSSPRFASTISCSSRGHPYIPKLEPFSRSKSQRFVKEPSLIEKSENELSGILQYLKVLDAFCMRKPIFVVNSTFFLDFVMNSCNILWIWWVFFFLSFFLFLFLGYFILVILVMICMAVLVVSDYCSTVEGDESYSCWRAYFELKDLEVSLFFSYLILLRILRSKKPHVW